MKVLFANIPFIKFDDLNEIQTGPNAGSRWPWTNAGFTSYACFPFFMGYAVQYLKANGIDAHFYDAVALKHWNDDEVKNAIASYRPDILFLETSTPLFNRIRHFAIWAKQNFSCRVVLTGPHIYTYGKSLIQEPYVDHVIIGEYEKPALDIARRLDQAEKIYTFDHLDDINTLNGENFLPYRPLDYLFNYLDPSMSNPRVQLQVSTSRGCPFKCTYCQWPKVMNNGKYRNRRPELVIDEIKTVIRQYQDYIQVLQPAIQDRLPEFMKYGRELASQFQAHLAMEQADSATRIYAALQEVNTTLSTVSSNGIQSIFFDDDTWNLGTQRIIDLCQGLKEIGLPWTMMGRIDTSDVQLYDRMVDSGCVGMRFGVESFNQRLLDNAKKKLSATTSYENIKYLITHFSNMEFHFTTMKNLPGETAEDWENDRRLLNDLQQLGSTRNNRIHWQNSDCIAFPGTELWEEMIEMGKGSELDNFELFDGDTHNNDKLAQVVGWLGKDYSPRWSTYSGMGNPTNLPQK